MIYVCIPAYNEERTLGVLLWKVRKVMSDFGRPYQILVLDDASTDDTAGLLDRYEGIVPVQWSRPEGRLGYGHALEQLLRSVVEESPYPKRDVAVTLQGDFTEDPEALVPMVKTIEGGADLVAGHLVREGVGVPAAVRVSRQLAPLVLGRAFRDAPVRDPLAGFRAYRVIVLKKAFRALAEGERLIHEDGWAANLELLAKVVPHTRRIEEAPYPASFLRRERESRFRVFAGLRSLISLRGTIWPPQPTPS